MRKVLFNLWAVVLFTALYACTDNELVNQKTDSPSLITVSEYPQYDSNSRAIGNFDSGNIEWISGDKIYLSSDGTNNWQEIKYDGKVWSTSSSFTSGTTVWAVFAPNCTLSSGVLSTPNGTGEYLKQQFTVASDRSLAINFVASQCRNYSRLRIAAVPNQSISVNTTYIPAGSTSAVTATSSSYTLTTDNKGNAYLYGKWESSNDLSIKYVDNSISTSNFNSSTALTSTPNKSYVFNAMPNYVINNGTWEIYRAAGLAAFRDQVNGLNGKTVTTGLNGKLMSDIDATAYTTWAGILNYAGLFDGNGKKVKVSINTPNQFAGLFERVIGGTVQNLSVSGSVVTTYTYTYRFPYAGGIASVLEDNGKIIGCCFQGTIASNYGAGGIVGALESGGTVSGCYSIADFSGKGSYFGGIIGANKSSNSISSCYWSGNINKGFGTSPAIAESPIKVDGTTGKTWEDAKTAMNTVLTTKGSIWYYEIQSNNVNEPLVVKPKQYTVNAGTWEIYNYEGLKEFRDQVNGFNGKTAINNLNAKLMADITFPNTREYTQWAGITDYRGIFDGNGKNITVNINVSTQFAGLFWHVNGGTIKNLSVSGSVITTLNKDNAPFAGGIACVLQDNGTIIACHTQGIISAGYSPGGIVGSLGDTTQGTITGCYSTATNTDGTKIVRVSGIVKNSPFPNASYWGSGYESARYDVTTVTTDTIPWYDTDSDSTNDALSKMNSDISASTVTTGSEYYINPDDATKAKEPLKLRIK